MSTQRQSPKTYFIIITQGVNFASLPSGPVPDGVRPGAVQDQAFDAADDRGQGGNATGAGGTTAADLPPIVMPDEDDDDRHVNAAAAAAAAAAASAAAAAGAAEKKKTVGTATPNVRGQGPNDPIPSTSGSRQSAMNVIPVITLDDNDDDAPVPDRNEQASTSKQASNQASRGSGRGRGGRCRYHTAKVILNRLKM